MRKIFLARPWLILTSICIVATGIALACAGGDEPEYGNSNFSPEIFVDSAYSPFFYSEQFYYGIGHDDDQHGRFNNRNVTEWSGYLNNQLSKTALAYLLQSAPMESVDSTIGFVTGKSPTSPLSMQTAVLATQKSNAKFLTFLSYLRLAKKSERFALDDAANFWEEKPKTPGKKIDYSALNNELLNGITKNADPFLKERYWFQLIRSYFFNGTAQQVISLFNQQEKTMPHNTIYYRTLCYTAGAYRKIKNYSKANYYYSKVFANCDELKTTAHFSFHPQETKDWNATLALCTNPDEQITLWQMLGIFYTDEARAANEIYRINPKSPRLDLLLARMINKYEQKFGSTDFAKPAAADTGSEAQTRNFIFRTADAGNSSKPWFWQMAAGYIKCLDGSYADATAWYAKAAKTMPANRGVQAQLRLLRLINNIGGSKSINNEKEKQWLPDIQWLANFKPDSLPQLRYTAAFDWLKRQLALRYIRQGELVKAECFVSTANFYGSRKNVEALKAYLDKPNKSAYDQLCAGLSDKKSGDLLEFQAEQLAYADSIDTAIEKMNHSTGAGTTLPGNPFNSRILDCHDCDHQAVQTKTYTKLDFLKKLNELKDKLAKGEDMYNNALLLGNAFYNLSHFGNARVFYECKVLGGEHSDPIYIDSVFRPMVTSMQLATKYYTRALQDASNDEQKAKCQYLLAKCQRNEWYNVNIYTKNESSYGDESMVKLSALTSFGNLKLYPNTQYYKEVLKECGYFRSYLSRVKN